jgi:hypothetical protein
MGALCGGGAANVLVCAAGAVFPLATMGAPQPVQNLSPGSSFFPHLIQKFMFFFLRSFFNYRLIIIILFFLMVGNLPTNLIFL